MFPDSTKVPRSAEGLTVSSDRIFVFRRLPFSVFVFRFGSRRNETKEGPEHLTQLRFLAFMGKEGAIYTCILIFRYVGQTSRKVEFVSCFFAAVGFFLVVVLFGGAARFARGRVVTISPFSEDGKRVACKIFLDASLRE